LSAEDENLDGIPKPGETIDGKYEVEAVVGAGGMGVVLAARHVALGQRVAVKFLLPDVAKRQPEAVERFLREARAATQLKSEHVARVMDVATAEGGAAYLVMEYLEGQDLRRVLEETGPLPIDALVDYALQAAEALAEAHARGIVHRDLKPANLFLTRGIDGSPLVKVLDFGISKAPATGERGITRTDAVMGSPGYMSPEQIRSAKNVDQRSDVWGLGIVLYELVTGRPPFDGDNIATLSAQIVTETPKPVETLRTDAPRALADAIAKCLEKEPSKRFSNMSELAAALAPFASPAGALVAERIRRMTGSGIAFAPTVLANAAESRALRAAAPTELAPSARTDGNWERSKLTTKGRSKAVLASGGAALVAVALVAFVAGRRSQKPEPEKVPAVASEEAPRAPVASSEPANAPAPTATPRVEPEPSAKPSSKTSPTSTGRDGSERRRPRITRPSQPTPRCEKGESLSNGHCCKTGLVWLNGRCDRPIATTLP
jgi:serine/threonine-protein kinase